MDLIDPEHSMSYYLIEFHCALLTYCKTNSHIWKEGSIFVAHGLSESDEEWLDAHGIGYELVNDVIVA